MVVQALDAQAAQVDTLAKQHAPQAQPQGSQRAHATGGMLLPPVPDPWGTQPVGATASASPIPSAQSEAHGAQASSSSEAAQAGASHAEAAEVQADAQSEVKGSVVAETVQDPSSNGSGKVAWQAESPTGQLQAWQYQETEVTS